MFFLPIESCKLRLYSIQPHKLIDMNNLARFTVLALSIFALLSACTNSAPKNEPCTLIENQPEGTARNVETLTAENVDKLIVKGGPTCIVIHNSRDTEVTVINSDNPEEADCKDSKSSKLQNIGGSIIITVEEDTAMFALRSEEDKQYDLSDPALKRLIGSLVITVEQDTID